MKLLLINLSLFSLLIIVFFLIKRKLGKNLLFEVTFLYKYIFYFCPFILFLVNIICTFIFLKQSLLLSFIPLLIPIVRLGYKALMNVLDEREYAYLEKTIIPIVMLEFAKINVKIAREQISIRILEKDKSDGRKNLNIVLNVPEINQPILDTQQKILNVLKLLLQSKYITELTLREPYKKK
jgi:hypothetical protein